MSWLLFLSWVLFAAVVLFLILITWLRARYDEKRRTHHQQQLLYCLLLLFCVLLSGSSLYLYERHALTQLEIIERITQSNHKAVIANHEQAIARIATVDTYIKYAVQREKNREDESKAALLVSERLGNALVNVQKETSALLAKIASHDSPLSICNDGCETAAHPESYPRNEEEYLLVQEKVDQMGPADNSWESQDKWEKHASSLLPSDYEVLHHFTTRAFELGEPTSDCSCRSPDCKVPTFSSPPHFATRLDELKNRAENNRLITLVIVGRHDIWPSHKISNTQLARQRAHCVARKLNLDYFPVLYTYASSRFDTSATPANRNKDRQVEVYGVYKNTAEPLNQVNNDSRAIGKQSSNSNDK